MKIKKFRLLLLDANVVIELFRHGIWDRLLEACDVHLAQTIVSREVRYYDDSQGVRHDLDLGKYVESGEITVFDVEQSDLTAFRAAFDPTYFERLDPGETESLVYLLSSRETCLICSADTIVYRVLGNLNRGEQGISLEEVLQRIGLCRELAWQFTRAFREKYTKKGFEQRMGGLGHRGGER